MVSENNLVSVNAAAADCSVWSFCGSGVAVPGDTGQCQRSPERVARPRSRAELSISPGDDPSSASPHSEQRERTVSEALCAQRRLALNPQPLTTLPEGPPSRTFSPAGHSVLQPHRPSSCSSPVHTVPPAMPSRLCGKAHSPCLSLSPHLGHFKWTQSREQHMAGCTPRPSSLGLCPCCPLGHWEREPELGHILPRAALLTGKAGPRHATCSAVSSRVDTHTAPRLPRSADLRLSCRQDPASWACRGTALNPASLHLRSSGNREA